MLRALSLARQASATGVLQRQPLRFQRLLTQHIVKDVTPAAVGSATATDLFSNVHAPLTAKTMWEQPKRGFHTSQPSFQGAYYMASPGTPSSGTSTRKSTAIPKVNVRKTVKQGPKAPRKAKAKTTQNKRKNGNAAGTAKSNASTKTTRGAAAAATSEAEETSADSVVPPVAPVAPVPVTTAETGILAHPRIAKWKASAIAAWRHHRDGAKLFVKDVGIGWQLFRKSASGETLTRRERRLLSRIILDMFRIIPLGVFMLVPLLEFLLPIALYIFPNMLPSQFEHGHAKEERERRALKARLEYTRLLQDSLELATEKLGVAHDEGKVTKKQILTFVERARRGEQVTTEEVVKYATPFANMMALESLDRTNLVAMCGLLGLNKIAPDPLLRYQITSTIRKLREDDALIREEGIDKMTKQELKVACTARGMAVLGESKAALRKQLSQWIDLSLDKEVPVLLLILSRALMLNSDEPLSDKSVADTMAALPDDVIKEVVAEAADDDEAESLNTKALEALAREEALIAEEKMHEASIKESLKLEIKEKLKEEQKEETTKKATKKKAKKTAVEESDDPDNMDHTQWEQVGEIVDVLAKKTSLGKEREIYKELAEELEAVKKISKTDSADAALDAPELTPVESDAAPPSQAATDVDTSATEPADTAEVLEEEAAPSTEEDPDTAARKKREAKAKADMLRFKEKMEKEVEKRLGSLAGDIEVLDSKIGDKFNILDQDQDGVIDRDELRAALERLTTKVDEATVDAMIEALDADQDGLISLEELEAKWRKVEEVRDLHEEVLVGEDEYGDDDTLVDIADDLGDGNDVAAETLAVDDAVPPPAEKPALRKRRRNTATTKKQSAAAKAAALDDAAAEAAVDIADSAATLAAVEADAAARAASVTSKPKRSRAVNKNANKEG